MNPSFYFDHLNSVFEHILDDFSSAAFITTSGQALFVKYENLVDIGTFPTVGEMSHKYLKLKDGDIVITNDPYSGGSVLSSVNFVMGICSGAAKNKSQADILLCTRLPFKPRVKLTENVDEEGIRIPPSPLFGDDQFNQQLLDAINMHPQCPERFEEMLRTETSRLIKARKQFRDFTESFELNWTKNKLKELFKLSKELGLELLNDISIGEASGEVTLEDGAKLKLKIEVGDETVLFDFSGSDTSQHLHLTDAATYGACAGALISSFNRKIPLNSGIFSCIEVVAPEGTIVNASYPKAVYQGMTDGAGIVANLALKTLGIIDQNKKVAISGASQCSFEIEFDDKKYFYETLETGAAGKEKYAGADGLYLWRRSHLNTSLEEVERRYPLRVNSYAYRLKSGGGGAFQGGDGVTKSFTLKAPGQLRWIITELQEKPEGVGGGKAATNAEILLQKPDGQREKLAMRGEMTLSEGDTLIISSAGGGGFGEAIIDEE